MPYHATWEHEVLQGFDGKGRVVEVEGAREIAEVIERMAMTTAIAG